MGRIVPVVLFALVIVAGGLWLEGRRQVDAQTAPVETETEPQLEAPEGFRAIPPVTDERRTSFNEAEKVLEEGLDYHALLETSKGPIIIDLFESRVPDTVNNFVFLALHNYYDGVPFHRVLEDFMAQTGDPTGTGTGGPGYTFEDEIVPELTHDGAGVVSMANAGPGTNGSQFFITFTATPWLDGKHTVFGQVVEGIEVLDELQRVDPGSPTAVMRLDGTLAELEEQGVSLDGEPDTTLQEYLESSLGAVPAMGQTFTLEGRVGVVGRAQGVPAAGFFPVPDTLEGVTVLVPEVDGASEGQSDSSEDGEAKGGSEDNTGSDGSDDDSGSGGNEEEAE